MNCSSIMCKLNSGSATDSLLIQAFFFLSFFLNIRSKEACKAVNIFTDTMETNTNTGVGGTLPNTFVCC